MSITDQQTEQDSQYTTDQREQTRSPPLAASCPTCGAILPVDCQGIDYELGLAVECHTCRKIHRDERIEEVLL